MVTVVARLVVLGRRERHHVATVRDADETRLFAIEILLDHDLPSGVTEAVPAQHALGSGEGFGLVESDRDALARRQPARLDDDGSPVAADVVPRRFEFGERLVAGSRDTVANEEILGEDLRPFQLRGSLRRSEAGETTRIEIVPHPVYKRLLRSDHG